MLLKEGLESEIQELCKWKKDISKIFQGIDGGTRGQAGYGTGR
jgi:hypothetical protein